VNIPSANSTASPAVTISYDDEKKLYRVNMDFNNHSHFEVGRQYAIELLNLDIDFERFADNSLYESFNATKMTFQQALFNAKVMIQNMPKDFADEIEGMASVFTNKPDTLGNKMLSYNKLILSVLQGEIVDDVPVPACSAAAVFGKKSATGHTIVARNNDWSPDPVMDSWNALFIFQNGDKSIGGNGSLGELIPSNLFNRWRMFACSLSSFPDSTQPLQSGTHSLSASIRHAMENFKSLGELENFIIEKGNNGSYAVGSLIMVADENTAHVIEYDITRDENSRALVRTDRSYLVEEAQWGIDHAIASVNSFLLPDSFKNNDDPHNKLRIDNFRRLIPELLEDGLIDMGKMSRIMGYTSKDGSANSSGAIYRLGIDECATFQSVVMRLDTFEMWLAYSANAHGASIPHTPVYYKILDENPFD
jgi:hypothetical protein